ncbi:MAG: hypothetical protein ACFHWZ_12025 [Phycisphaerales bacterium]
MRIAPSVTDWASRRSPTSSASFAPVEHAEVEVALEFEPGPPDHLGEDQGQGAVADDAADPGAAQKLGGRLGGGDLAIAGQSSVGREVGGAGDAIGRRVRGRDPSRCRE